MTGHTASASARKVHGKYKAVILHPQTAPPFNIARVRTEFIGTRWHVSEDGRDMRVTKGAPLYATREEAIRVAQAMIEYRARKLAEVRSAYTARHRTDDEVSK